MRELKSRIANRETEIATKERKCDQRRGFTLIEVIVVLTLMSLIMGLGAVYFAGNSASSKIARSVREISGAVRYGRVLAAETGSVQSMIFDLDAHSYGIEGRTTRNIPADIAIRITDGLEAETNRGKHTVYMLPSGAVQGGTIVLQKGQSTVSIHPDPIVGVAVVKQ
jgi:type II secretion system protein H